MRTLTLLLVLFLAACSTRDNQPANAGNEPHSGHDHFHAHAGASHPLGTVDTGGVKVSAWLKDRINPGALTVLELKVEGAAITPAQLRGEVLDAAGKAVATFAGFHQMQDEGRFGGHVLIENGATRPLRARFTVVDREPSIVAEFEIKEQP